MFNPSLGNKNVSIKKHYSISLELHLTSIVGPCKDKKSLPKLFFFSQHDVVLVVCRYALNALVTIMVVGLRTGLHTLRLVLFFERGYARWYGFSASSLITE